MRPLRGLQETRVATREESVQYFGHLLRRVDSLEKTLMLGGIGGRRRKGRQRMRWLDGITDLMDIIDQRPLNTSLERLWSQILGASISPGIS